MVIQMIDGVKVRNKELMWSRKFQSDLLEIIKKWEILKKRPIRQWSPEYRNFTCGNCYREVRKVWHVWCFEGGFKQEMHLCKQCGKELGLNCSCDKLYKKNVANDEYTGDKFNLR